MSCICLNKYLCSKKGHDIMKKNLRSNELQKAKQVSGNVLTELNEAELGSISGAGEVRGSNGGFCTFTVEWVLLNNLVTKRRKAL